MPTRTTHDAVKDILKDDYGPREDGTLPSLASDIKSASVIVSRVIICATARGYTLTADEIERIEAHLAAHFYAISDKPFASNSTQGASASYHGQTGMYLEFTPYGQMATRLDPSGCLAAIATGERKVARGGWLGKNPTDQIDYIDRR